MYILAHLWIHACVVVVWTRRFFTCEFQELFFKQTNETGNLCLLFVVNLNVLSSKFPLTAFMVVQISIGGCDVIYNYVLCIIVWSSA